MKSNGYVANTLASVWAAGTCLTFAAKSHFQDQARLVKEIAKTIESKVPIGSEAIIRDLLSRAGDYDAMTGASCLALLGLLTTSLPVILLRIGSHERED
jgi:hypothetical protein